MDINNIWDDLGSNDHLAYKGSSRSISDLIQDMNNNGLDVVSLDTSGEVNRVKVKATPNTRPDRSGEASGWYFFYDNGNGNFFCNYGNWRTNESFKYSSVDTQFMSVQEQAQLKKELDKRNKEQQERREQNYREVAKDVQGRFQKTKDLKEHDYLTIKGVKNYGFKELNGNLTIPLYDTLSPEFPICSMQTIYKDGTKRFVSGSRVKGSFFPLGFSINEISNLNKIIITEGLATSCSIYEATELPVICVFSANFGLECLTNLRKYTQAKFVIAFDNDKHQVGQEQAKKIQASINNVEVKIPNKSGYDFNDIHKELGLAEVKSQLMISAFNIRAISLRQFDTNPPERSWLVKNLIESGKTGLMASAGGIGKSFLNLSLAFNCARGEGSFLGNPIERFGNCVLLVAEDDVPEIHRRIQMLDPNNTRQDSMYDVYIISVPELGKPLTLIKEDLNQGLHITSEAYDIIDGLSAIPDLVMLSIDPLQAFIGAQTNNNETGQLYSIYAQMIATRFDTAVVGVHHLSKAGLVDNPDFMQLRASIRGASSFVDSSRWCLALSTADPESGKQICLENGEEYDRMKVIRCGIVKANSEADMSVKTLIRKNGVLELVKENGGIQWEN